MTPDPNDHETAALEHLARAHALHDEGDPARADSEARQAIREMRASARARMHEQQPIGGNMDTPNHEAPSGAETYSAFLTRVREAAGFPNRRDAVRQLAGDDPAASKRWTASLWNYEEGRATPRRDKGKIKALAALYGVTEASLHPDKFMPGAVPARRVAKVPAKAATAAAAAPAQYLRGIQIEPAGDGLWLLRFEAVLPSDRSADVIPMLLAAASIAAGGGR